MSDFPVLFAPNMRHVYIANNEFGECAYVVAESFEDAYDELLTWIADRDGVCDHGGELTDEQRTDGGACDCSQCEDGRWVWDVYYGLRPLALSVDQFLLAADWVEVAS